MARPNGASRRHGRRRWLRRASARLPYRCPKLGRILHPTERSCVISGTGGRGFLLVGDSHADVLKGILGEEVAAAGGTLRLMVANEPLGPTLPPEAALAEAAANGATVIVLHSTVEHFNLAAIRALAVQAQRSGISVAVVEPAPPPGFHVPERIYSLLQAGQPVRPTRTLADYRRDFGAIMAGLEALARGCRTSASISRRMRSAPPVAH